LVAAASVSASWTFKSEIRSAWLNDRDPGIACLWCAVHQYPADLKQCVTSFIPSPTAFSDFKTRLLALTRVPDDPAEIVRFGFEKLALHRISYSSLGTMAGAPRGGLEQKGTDKVDCRWNPDSIAQEIDRIHSKFNGMNVRITNIDFGRLITDTEEHGLLYLDNCAEIRRLYRWAQISPIEVQYSVAGARRTEELLIFPRRSTIADEIRQAA
jgi:hypothetical protein